MYENGDAHEKVPIDTRYLIGNKFLSKSNIAWHPAAVQLLTAQQGFQ